MSCVNHILEKEFKDYKANAKEQAKSTIESLKESYGGEETLLQAIQSNTNYTSIADYEEVVYLSYMREHATLEYVKDNLSEKEINKYYRYYMYGQFMKYAKGTRFKADIHDLYDFGGVDSVASKDGDTLTFIILNDNNTPKNIKIELDGITSSKMIETSLKTKRSWFS